MSEAAVKLAAWFPGADPVTILPGDDGFEALVPLFEPLSAGEPPLPPQLVDNLSVALPVRRADSRAGYAQTFALDTLLQGRPTATLRWAGLTKAERDSVWAFLKDDCGSGEYGFTIFPDGAHGGSVVVRALAPATDTMLGRGAAIVYEISVSVEALCSGGDEPPPDDEGFGGPLFDDADQSAHVYSIGLI